MEIFGNRVYLLLPELPDTKVKLLPEAQERLQEEMIEKFNELEVYAMGNIETTAIGSHIEKPKLKVGDRVFVDPNAVRRAIRFKIDDKWLTCVNFYDIMHKV